VVVASAAQARPTASGLAAQLARHVKTLKHDRHVIRFFESHRWLLDDPRFRREARRQLAAHRRSRAATARRIARLEATLEKRRTTRRLAALAKAPPRLAICTVFGKRYCTQALRVARCESNLTTSARNGQYLGLFQMGSWPRELFGHGASAFEQARAAHRYFIHSGRDWSPWTCKPW
jgi:hypothetical protein